MAKKITRTMSVEQNDEFLTVCKEIDRLTDMMSVQDHPGRRNRLLKAIHNFRITRNQIAQLAPWTIIED